MLLERHLLIVAIAAVTLEPLSSNAQSFGIGRELRNLERGISRGLRVPDGVDVFHERRLRKSLGAVAVAAIGLGILGRLSKADQAELSRRTLKVVRADPGTEVVETYDLDKGKRTITIKASPSKPKSDFENDPSIAPENDAHKNADANKDKQSHPTSNDDKPSNTDKKKPSREDDGSVAFDDVPASTNCRRVETKVAQAGTTKTDAAPEDANVALICEFGDDDWKPVRRSKVATAP